MAQYFDCIARLQEIAQRELSDQEVAAVFERIHKAALDLKNGKDFDKGFLSGAEGDEATTLIQRAAELASKDLIAEAAQSERRAGLQILRLGARTSDIGGMEEAGIQPLDAVEKTLVRDYTGKVNIESLEQKATGYRDYFNRQLLDTWESLGDDFLGFFQDEAKVINLVKELRGESSGDALAKRGAEAFHKVAEEARLVFNENGGSVGKLDDWGMPQHHSQERVAAAGGPDATVDQSRQAWVDNILPLLDRERYVDEITGRAWDENTMQLFLGKAWDTIATNGHANTEAGKSMGTGSRASRHAEERQIHFKSAEANIEYWHQFGDRTIVEVLSNHIDTMAKDIAFVEWGGPDPNMTHQTLRDAALTKATLAAPTKTEALEGRAVGLDNLYEYAAGRTKPTYRQWLKQTADGVANLNTAGKLGGAALASFFGDKPMMEAVSHLNSIPAMQRWRTELSLLNPANTADRQAIRVQGLMIDSIRSGLQRFYEGLGQSSTTGKIAGAVMRISGMQAINDIRKGAFGLSLMATIGNQLDEFVLPGGANVTGLTAKDATKAGVIKRPRPFEKLDKSDVRALRNFGITKEDWSVWQLAQRDTLAGVDNVLTPEGISRITDEQLMQAGLIESVNQAPAVRRNAMVKLLGVVNTESEFAIVTPGWKERAVFYGGEQRGTVKGEFARSWLQFKSFPWAVFQRGMDAVANMDGPASKAVMSAFLVSSTTVAGAMLMTTRDILAGRDPRSMMDKDWYKYWGQAFVQGGALGIYGDFLYGANQTRMGSGILEAISGPTIGPLLELGLVNPMAAARGAMDGKDTHLAAKTLSNLKGFVPGGNLWYTRSAMDHLIWQRSMEALSPGYLSNMRQRQMKDFGQSNWWEPGETTPARAPDMGKVFEQ